VWPAGQGRFSSPSTLPSWGPICRSLTHWGSKNLPHSDKVWVWAPLVQRAAKLRMFLLLMVWTSRRRRRLGPGLISDCRCVPGKVGRLAAPGDKGTWCRLWRTPSPAIAIPAARGVKHHMNLVQRMRWRCYYSSHWFQWDYPV